MSSLKHRYGKVAPTITENETLQYNKDQPKTSLHPYEDKIERIATKVKDFVYSKIT